MEEKTDRFHALTYESLAKLLDDVQSNAADVGEYGLYEDLRYPASYEDFLAWLHEEGDLLNPEKED